MLDRRTSNGHRVIMKNINVEKLNQLINEFVQERDWDQFHSIKNLSMALNVESSELLEIFQWMSETDSNQIRQDHKILSKVEDELADILYYLIRIAGKVQIDLEATLINKIQKNAEKYPVKLARGNSKKYDEL